MCAENYNIKNLSKHYVDEYGHNVHLLNEVEFLIGKGKVNTVLGPTGSGKSALLKIIAGLEKADGDPKTNISNTIYIPAKPSSFPWLDVRENIVFGLVDNNSNEIDKVIKFVGLSGYENHYANNSSIAFRFRISLARALVRKPEIIIIDEAFSNIAPQYKFDIYNLIRETNKQLELTFLIGTSNLKEAIYLSDIIFLMKKNPGEIFQTSEVTFESERNINLFGTEEFKSAKNSIENKITEEIGSKFYSFSI